MIGLLCFSQTFDSEILFTVDISVSACGRLCEAVVYACVYAVVAGICFFNVNAEGFIIERRW